MIEATYISLAILATMALIFAIVVKPDNKHQTN